MQTIEELREAARNKLTGYTEREIDCFVQGGMYMMGNMPQKRSEEWYEQQARKKEENVRRSEDVCRLFQKATGLKEAVDAIQNIKTEEEVVTHAFTVLFENVNTNPEFRKQVLDLMDAEEKSVSREIIGAVKTGMNAFNERHSDIVLDFRREEENNGLWTFVWDEAL